MNQHIEWLDKIEAELRKAQGFEKRNLLVQAFRHVAIAEGYLAGRGIDDGGHAHAAVMSGTLAVMQMNSPGVLTMNWRDTFRNEIEQAISAIGFLR